jgi:hypothetical protein
VRPSTLKLTKLDDEIYQDMEETFPDLRVTDEDKTGGVLKVDEDKMKSANGKKQWRDFIQRYENKGECYFESMHSDFRPPDFSSLLFLFSLAVSDYNFGTLIRTDASDEYTQFNTTFGKSKTHAY